jgi:hypothetical protein
MGSKRPTIWTVASHVDLCRKYKYHKYSQKFHHKNHCALLKAYADIINIIPDIIPVLEFVERNLVRSTKLKHGK